MGRRPKARGRNVHGMVLVDKPAGLTSNDCLQQIKRLFNANRAGHTGSLDKPATGMLPICLGEATKLSSYLLDADKEYTTRCRLGITTTTGDAAGEVLDERPVPEFSEDDILQALGGFQGRISQIPPMYSALKHQGKRLYQLAYQNQEVERKPRDVDIHTLELTGYRDSEFSLRVACSKGTYIRTLAMDIGEALGCGAHVLQLHRVRVGQFTQDSMHAMSELRSIAERGLEPLDQTLLPMDGAISHLPAVTMELNTAHYLLQGQAVTVPKAPTSGLLRLYDEDKTFLGIGHILSDGRVAPKRLLHFADTKA